jgi:glycosyltransferase involved in cell wall biosynthesis
VANDQVTRTGQPSGGETIEVAALIRVSPHFDHAYYLAQGGQGRDVAAAVRDYLDRGEAAGLQPSADFDPAFYLSVYSDVANAGVGALAHYVEHGEKERRYPNRRRLAADAKMIVDKALFDPEQYALQMSDNGGDLGLTDAEHYLIFGGFLGAWPSADFDSLFYRGVYSDVSATRENPLVHYARLGRKERRLINGVMLADALERIKDDFDAGYYLRQNATLTEEDRENLPRHYLLHGTRLGLEPAADFSAAYYTRLYPDIAQSNGHPYVHFVEHGREEGRVGHTAVRSLMKTGEVEFDSDRPTVLIANHEGSRTGAPLVGLALAHAFAETHNVITYLGRDSGMVEPFFQTSTLVIVGQVSAVDAEVMLRELKRRFGLSCVLANSVESHAIVKAALQADMPCVALIHEFAEYTLPRGKIWEVVAAADRVVVPAKIVLEAAQKELVTFCGAPSSNITVRPQGRLVEEADPVDTDLSAEEILRSMRPDAAAKPRIVLGAGFVQTRKGVDLFAQTARDVMRLSDEDVCFVWVGAGYEPDHDVATSVWLKEQIARQGLEDKVFLFPAQSHLEAFFEIADVFYLPSRLDPYPNVGVDAFDQGKPLVCFRDATGLSEPIEAGQVIGSVVDYCDTAAAARAILDHLASDVDAKSHNARFVRENLDFSAYATFLKDELDKAVKQRALLIEARDRLEASELFDDAFYMGVAENLTPEVSLNIYVANASKGLTPHNPRPGFHDGVWRVTQGKTAPPGVVPLDAASRGVADAPTTHHCHRLTGKSGGQRPEGGVALHVHMHYPELAPVFVQRLKTLRTPIDLFVTTTSRDKQIEIQAAMLGYKRGKVEVLVGPNRGRDIGPFMSSIGEAVLAGGYGLVGHLHGKKSLATVGALGDRWRNYLLDTLLGKPSEVAEIFDLFARDPKLGLVFAEDRHAIGWSKNRALSEALADRLTPRPRLPDYPLFPLGNMFWARPAAVQPLWAAGLEFDDYPSEPLPVDGTVLHAVERILPAICESTGHGWCTVFKTGSGW